MSASIAKFGCYRKVSPDQGFHSYTPSGKKNKNIVMNEKPPKCTCMPKVLAFLSQPEQTYQSLTPQLETVIIEVSTVQALRLRANPQLLHGAIHLPSRNGTYGDTGFYNAQTSYLNMEVVTFAKDENIRFLLNHC